MENIPASQNIYLKSLIDKYKPGSKATLIYRATRDGFENDAFHSGCDNQGPTVTLFKTDIGTICGGFASVSWKSTGGSCNDSNAFLFSLDRQLVFPVQDASLALHFSTETGPFFGKKGETCLGKYESFSYVTHVTNYDRYKVGTDSNGNSLLTGKPIGNFTAVEIETFKLTW